MLGSQRLMLLYFTFSERKKMSFFFKINVNSKLQTLDNLYKSNRVLIIKTTLENDVIISKKIIF